MIALFLTCVKGSQERCQATFFSSAQDAAWYLWRKHCSGRSGCEEILNSIWLTHRATAIRGLLDKLSVFAGGEFSGVLSLVTDYAHEFVPLYLAGFQLWSTQTAEPQFRPTVLWVLPIAIGAEPVSLGI